MGYLRAVLTLLCFYVAADLFSPLIPGAFSFDPDASVDFGRLERPSQTLPIRITESPRFTAEVLPPRPARPGVAGPPAAGPVRQSRWLPCMRATSDAAPPSPTDDHLA